MIDVLMITPPLHLVFDRTKWNGDLYNNPYEIKTTTGYESNVVKRVNPPNPLGRHPLTSLRNKFMIDCIVVRPISLSEYRPKTVSLTLIVVNNGNYKGTDTKYIQD